MSATLLSEFPDFPIDGLPPIPEGFGDNHRINDGCPSWHNAHLGMTLYIDHPDESKRIDPPLHAHRYTLQRDAAQPGYRHLVASSNDWPDILAAIARLETDSAGSATVGTPANATVGAAAGTDAASTAAATECAPTLQARIDHALSAGATVLILTSDRKHYAIHPKDQDSFHRIEHLEDAGVRDVGGATTLAAAHDIALDHATGVHERRTAAFWAAFDAAVAETGLADTMKAHGYIPVHTGGGCMAWSKQLADTSALMITNGDAGIDGDPNAPIWVIGRYDDDDGSVDVHATYTLAAAVAAASTLPPPRDRNGDTVQESYETVSDAIAALGAP